jgi:hypothetical protein
MLRPRCPQCCTVARLKRLLAEQCGYAAEHIALRCGGVALRWPPCYRISPVQYRISLVPLF